MNIHREDLPDSVYLFMEKDKETGVGFILVNKNLPEEEQERYIRDGLAEWQKKYGETF